MSGRKGRPTIYGEPGSGPMPGRTGQVKRPMPGEKKDLTEEKRPERVFGAKVHPIWEKRWQKTPEEERPVQPGHPERQVQTGSGSEGKEKPPVQGNQEQQPVQTNRENPSAPRKERIRRGEREQEARQRVLWWILGGLIVILIAAILYEIVLGNGIKAPGSARISQEMKNRHIAARTQSEWELESDAVEEETEGAETGVSDVAADGEQSGSGDMTADGEQPRAGDVTADGEQSGDSDMTAEAGQPGESGTHPQVVQGGVLEKLESTGAAQVVLPQTPAGQ